MNPMEDQAPRLISGRCAASTAGGCMSMLRKGAGPWLVTAMVALTSIGVAPVARHDVELVHGALRHALEHALPYARGAAPLQRVGDLVPVVEVADHGHGLRFRRPHGEMRAGRESRQGLCAELPVEPAVGPLVEQVEVIVREEGLARRLLTWQGAPPLVRASGGGHAVGHRVACGADTPRMLAWRSPVLVQPGVVVVGRVARPAESGRARTISCRASSTFPVYQKPERVAIRPAVGARRGRLGVHRGADHPCNRPRSSPVPTP